MRSSGPLRALLCLLGWHWAAACTAPGDGEQRPQGKAPDTAATDTGGRPGSDTGDTAGPRKTWFRDRDLDGYGDQTERSESATSPDGWVGIGGDCDDGDASIHPEAVEVCDSVDQDCDGSVDDLAIDAVAWYFDSDADGFGDPATVDTSCEAPGPGWLTDGTDCDDSTADAHPGAAEVCGDGADNDCAGDGDLRCRPTGTWSLGATFTRLYGAVDYQATGSVVAVGGDVQGSGTTTVLSLSSFRRDPSTHPGQVTLVESFPIGTSTINDAGPTILGDPAVDLWFGSAGVVGDTNGDGFDEVIFGVNSGTQAVILEGPIAEGSDAANPDVTISYETSIGIGYSFTSLSDSDGDGLDEPVVTNTGNNYDPVWGWSEDAGRVYVFSGPLIGEISASTAGAKIQAHPVFQFIRVGVSIDSEDIDGDGISDLAIGAPAATSEYVQPCRSAGTVYILHGPLSGDIVLDDESCNLDAADAIWTGFNPAENLGWSLSVGGDEDGDGLNDLLIGAPSAVTGDPGSAYLIRSPSVGAHSIEGASWALHSTLPGDVLGWSVTLGSDLDSDGSNEVAVTSAGTGDEGCTLLFYGSALAGSTSPSSADAVFEGEAALDAAYQVAGGGDVDGDGFDDLVIGAKANSTYAAWGGAAYVIFGGSPP